MGRTVRRRSHDATTSKQQRQSPLQTQTTRRLRLPSTHPIQPRNHNHRRTRQLRPPSNPKHNCGGLRKPRIQSNQLPRCKLHRGDTSLIQFHQTEGSMKIMNQIKALILSGTSAFGFAKYCDPTFPGDLINPEKYSPAIPTRYGCGYTPPRPGPWEASRSGPGWRCKTRCWLAGNRIRPRRNQRPLT